MVSLLALGAMGLAAFGLGRPIARRLGVPAEDALEVAVWSATIGAIAFGLALGLLGLVGAIWRPVVGIGTLAAAFWGAGQIVWERLSADRAARKPREIEFAWPGGGAGAGQGPPRWLARLVWALAGAACLGSLAGALAPPTSGEALAHHLELAKRFLAAGGFVDLPYHDGATGPLLVEMGYLWGLALEGPVAAQLVHWAWGTLFALATVVLARPILGKGWAWLAGGLVVLTPGVNHQMTAALDVAALAALATLALAAWWRATVGREDRRWFALAGLTGGAALGVTPVAVLFVLSTGAAWIGAAVRRHAPRRTLLEGAAIAMAVAVATAGPWYARAAWRGENPLPPTWDRMADVAADVTPVQGTAPAPPSARALLELPAAPWQVTMRPERFGGRADQLGVVYLAALPGLAFARRLRGLGMLLAVAGAYVLAWYLLARDVRSLLPIAGCLAVGVAWVAMESRRMAAAPRRMAAAVGVAILSVSAVVAMAHTREQWAVAAGVEPREQYLARREPSFAAASVTNLMAQGHWRLLSQDGRAFYFEPPVVCEPVFRRVAGYDRAVREPSDLSRVLRRAGFTHLVLVERLDGGAGFDPTFTQLAEADPTVREIAAFRAASSGLAARRYRLLQLGDVR
ncbi:MAG: hypothetical protein JW809_01145 [Pirellulales bacterium]|nr:hypothetical protein [Pirellulales bacterium]